MSENFFSKGIRQVVESVEDAVDGVRARNVGANLGKEAVRTRKLLAEIDQQHPELRTPHTIDPALKALLEEKVKQGRMTLEDFESELAKYQSDSIS